MNASGVVCFPLNQNVLIVSFTSHAHPPPTTITLYLRMSNRYAAFMIANVATPPDGGSVGKSNTNTQSRPLPYLYNTTTGNGNGNGNGNSLGEIPPGVVDIDAKSFKSATYDPTYARSICASKRKMELRYVQPSVILTSRDGMQTEINSNMRITLLSWLVKTAEDYRLENSTYHLAVQFLDHALSIINVKRGQFQLLGCACLWLAAKLEELQPPQVNSLVFIADYCFDAEQLMNYEQKLMRLFEYKAAMPTRHYFAMRYVRAAECTPREICLVQYLVELSLYDVNFLQYPMSMVAATAVHLALQQLRPLRVRKGGIGSPGYSHRATEPYVIWTDTLRFYTEYEEIQLIPVLRGLSSLHFSIEQVIDTSEGLKNEMTEGFKNVYRKYDQSAFHHVSLLMSSRPEDARFTTAAAEEAWKQHHHGVIDGSSGVARAPSPSASDTDAAQGNLDFAERIVAPQPAAGAANTVTADSAAAAPDAVRAQHDTAAGENQAQNSTQAMQVCAPKATQTTSHKQMEMSALPAIVPSVNSVLMQNQALGQSQTQAAANPHGQGQGQGQGRGLARSSGSSNASGPARSKRSDSFSASSKGAKPPVASSTRAAAHDATGGGSRGNGNPRIPLGQRSLANSLARGVSQQLQPSKPRGNTAAGVVSEAREVKANGESVSAAKKPDNATSGATPMSTTDRSNSTASSSAQSMHPSASRAHGAQHARQDTSSAVSAASDVPAHALQASKRRRT